MPVCLQSASDRHLFLGSRHSKVAPRGSLCHSAATLLFQMQNSLLFAIGTELLLEDNPKATVYFIKLASSGHEQAIFVLGMFLEFGIFIPKDISMAYEYYKRSNTCAGFARICFLKTHGRPGLQIDSVEGEGFKKKALSIKSYSSYDWLNYTARKGLAESLFCLAIDHFNGITGPKQPALAYKYCLSSAERGLSQAQNLLGNMYIEGVGVNRDASLGLEWYIKAAEQHDPTSIYNIGTLFERGVAVEQSWETAIEWYSKAALLKSANAHNVLGILNEQGIIDSSTPQQAYYHYKQAAILGHSHAQYNLARCCHDGYGCPVDNKQAFEYFTLSANQKHQMALLSLAVFYEFAIHVKKDFKKAIFEFFDSSMPLMFDTLVSRITDNFRITQSAK